jgi:hypothetical protein
MWKGTRRGEMRMQTRRGTKGKGKQGLGKEERNIDRCSHDSERMSTHNDKRRTKTYHTDGNDTRKMFPKKKTRDR